MISELGGNKTNNETKGTNHYNIIMAHLFLNKMIRHQYKCRTVLYLFWGFLFYLNLFYISASIIIFQFYNRLLLSSLYFTLL